MFNVRQNCIFCKEKLTISLLAEDLKIATACYSTESPVKNLIPYNVLICSNCKTSQIKYLGDLNEVYKINHADGTGSIMTNLHFKVKDLILNFNKNNTVKINNIVEIGASKGILSDILLDEQLVDKYYIIEPNFIGVHRENKIVINNYFENVNFNEYNDCNTILISHVLEHFYNPIEILEIVQQNNSIKNFILVWPDLQYYKNNDVYHVLNTEHTYYVDNNFIVDLFNNHNFELITQEEYLGHSVLFMFKRNNKLPLKKLQNNDYLFETFVKNIYNKKEQIATFIKQNTCKKIAIWPASVHTQFLFVFLGTQNVEYVLDNSPHKIDKYLYGYSLKCLDFKQYVNDENFAVILNGGVFNNEVKPFIKNPNVLYIN